MKYALYTIWFLVIFLGAFINSCIPSNFHYLFGFLIGAVTQAILIYANNE